MEAKTLKKMRDYSNSQSHNPNNIRMAADEEIVQSFLQSDIDKASILEVQRAGNVLTDIDSKYDNDELNGKTPEALLNEIKGQFEKAQIDALVNDCKNTVLDSLIGPFGLSHDMIVDKDGGNVTTIHNAKQGIYPNENDTYNRDKQYKYGDSLSKYKNKKINANGKIVDEYTGKEIDPDCAETDHVYSLKDFHENGGYMLDDNERSAFAKDDRNYAVTNRGTNRSKREHDLKDFESKTIQDQENSNKDRFDIDDRRTNAKYKKGIETAEYHLPDKFQKAQYYAKKSVTTGIKQGTQYGFQQAIGLILREITTGIFDEIKDIYDKGLEKDTKSFFGALKIRAVRVINKVKSKWKDYLVAFKDGAISGFLSNFVTVLINLFATTEAKFVKMIREGAMSLFRACKLLINHPDTMTMAQAAHEATKLIVTGLGISLGILIDEALRGLLLAGPLAPLAGIISSVVSSLATGILTLIAVYIIDKIDLFNVKADEKQEYINGVLQERQNSVRNETQEYLNIIGIS